MANAGINKAQVKKARDLLVAKGLHPSIDAVRIELGNTGSKNTIHRYLKELNDESAVHEGNRVPLSDALSELVAGLAAQMHREAEDIIEQANANTKSIISSLQAKIDTGEQALLSAKQQIAVLQSQLDSSEQRRVATANEHQESLLKNERLSQELHDKDVQVAAKDNHIESLEEKHQHARLALEHYRDSVKDQREQDARRHETQVQQLQSEIRQLNQTISVKQTDITQLNKDNSQLVTEARELRKQLLSNTNKLEQVEQHLKNNEEKLFTANQKEVWLLEKLKDNENVNEHLIQQQNTIKSLEVELISVKTELNVKNSLLESFKSTLKENLANAQ
jgi:chromosome segregation ATPase